jgi:hypothetical protein
VVLRHNCSSQTTRPGIIKHGNIEMCLKHAILTFISGMVAPPRNSTVKSTIIRVDVTRMCRFSDSKSRWRLSANAIAPRNPEIKKQMSYHKGRKK